MSWTDERIEKLTKMWEGGATASQIADELGGVSRNAVIGKAHRLGLKARPQPGESRMTSQEPAAKPAKPAAESAPRAAATPVRRQAVRPRRRVPPLRPPTAEAEPEMMQTAAPP